MLKKSSSRVSVLVSYYDYRKNDNNVVLTSTIVFSTLKMTHTIIIKHEQEYFRCVHNLIRIVIYCMCVKIIKINKDKSRTNFTNKNLSLILFDCYFSFRYIMCKYVYTSSQNIEIRIIHQKRELYISSINNLIVK